MPGKGLSFTFTQVVLEHGRGPVIKQKRKVLATLMGVGLGALVRKIKKSTDWHIPFITPSARHQGS